MSMAAAGIVSEDLAAMQVQVSDINLLIQESADFELAYEMQLSEAMSASVSGLASSSTNAGDDEDGGEEMSVEKEAALKDREFAVTEQALEMERLNQEMEDEINASKEQSRLRELDAIRQHDERFARLLSTALENELDDYADPFPYTPEEETVVSRRPEETVLRSPLLPGTSTSQLIMCHSDMSEPVRAAAFFLDPHGPEGKSYLTTINEGFHRADSEDDEHEDKERKKTKFPDHSEDDELEYKYSRKKSTFPRCSICTERSLAPENSYIVSDGCQHRFCTKCLEQYAEGEVKSGKSNVKCPEFKCEETCSYKIIEQLLPTASLLLLVQREVEEAIPVSERVYCPFPGCSALHVIPTLPDQASLSSQAHNTASSGVECFSCNRYFCFSCKVPWHGDLTCEEFQDLPVQERGAEDRRLKGLAKLSEWQRCRKCGFFVELTSGCTHISCRCGYEFCYVCGGSWKHGHLCKTASESSHDL